jgi:NADH-quinone oxidoreductase subunit A
VNRQFQKTVLAGRRRRTALAAGVVNPPRRRYAAVVSGYLGSYATLGLLLLAGAAFFVVAFAANRLLRPARPAEPPGKRTTYECGLDPVGGDWAQAQIRYYVYAYLYVLFAVESVFLFPWAVVFDRPGFGVTVVVEMGIFVAILALGILYAWRKRVLHWT